MKKVNSVLVMMTILTSFSFAQVSLDSALVASYYFSNNFADNSGNGNTANNAGATFTNDRFGNPNYAIYFNGSSYLDFPNAVRFQPLSSASLSFWMKSSKTDRFDLFEQRISNYTPSDLNYNITFNYPSTQHVHYNFPNYNNPPDNYTSYNVSSGSAIDGKWHHFVFTKDVLNNTMSIYLDNLLLGTRTIQDVSFTVNGTLRIGKEISGTYWYTGYIDDIRFYSRPLNTSEIQALFIESPSGIEQQNSETKIYIYPNPTGGKINIQTDRSFGEIRSIEIYNYVGQLQIIKLTDLVNIDLSALSSGLYFMVLTNADNKRLTSKIIKE